MSQITIVVALACITALEIVALLKDLDGAYLLPIAGLLAGIVGYKIKEARLPITINKKNGSNNTAGTA